jgi:AAA family ATPase
MSFEVSLKGPKRSFIVESFTNDGKTVPCTMVRFGGCTSVKIAGEENSVMPDIPDGPRPVLQIPNVAGIERALIKLNEFLADFDDEQTTEPAWGQRSCGVLLHGAHGTGKSLILKKISDTGWGKVFNISTPTKSTDVQHVFKNARQAQPSVIIIDDIDAIVSKENSSSSDIFRVLGEEMDSLTIDNPGDAPKIVVVAATSVPNEVSRSLRKRGRFTTEILLPLPGVDARKRILRALAPSASTDDQLALLDRLGDRTHAYTAEDLGLLLDESCRVARRRCRVARFEGAEASQSLLQEDIDQALLSVRPSAMHDVTLQPPKVRWDDIGGQDNIKKALRRAVEIPFLV